MLARFALGAFLITSVTDVAPMRLAGEPQGEQACAEYAAERCAKIDSCSRNTQVALLYGEASTCLLHEMRACEGRVSAKDSNLTASHVTGCSAAIRRASCAEWQKATGCRPPPGKRPPGDPCDVSAQCATTFCSGPKDGNGICARLPNEGEPCSGACAVGTFCGANGLCDALVDVGAPCNDTHYCAPGFRCMRSSEQAEGGECVRAAMHGEPCDARAIGAASCDTFSMLICGESSGVCEDDVPSIVQVVARMTD